jgi:ribonuclease P protein subunit POP4
MTITHSNLSAHELIGLKATVSASSDSTKLGVTGIVRDETRNTLTIQIRDRFFCIPKTGSSIAFETPDGRSTTIEGASLVNRPEDRVKRGISRW